MIGHLDADCFYVSAERVRHPDLAGKPVGVLGNQGACVIAKSYEMKAAGVKTGMPIWEARKLCPDGVYVKRDFRWYEVLSRMMLDIVGEHAEAVEYYSIDEFFFRAAPLTSRSGLADAAAAVRDHIRDRAGLPVTVAIARTRTLAKLFSDTAKPNGCLAVTTVDQERALLGRLPVTEISGVGGRRAARLAPYGIKSCLDLADADGGLVRRVLTSTGFDIWRELNGFPAQPVRPSRSPHKVLARGGSLGGDVSDPRVLWGWAVRNLERLVEELEYHRVRPGSLSLQIAYKDGIGTGAEGPLDTPTDRFDLLLDALRPAVRRCWRPGQSATHMHVIAAHLKRAIGEQLTLFRQPDPKREAVARAKRDINAAVGRFAVRSGATLYLPAELYADPSHSYDVCDIRGKVCF
ncbi:MAG: nucleotidyltransferase [Gemmataceae bacterium]